MRVLNIYALCVVFPAYVNICSIPSFADVVVGRARVFSRTALGDTACDRMGSTCPVRPGDLSNVEEFRAIFAGPRAVVWFQAGDCRLCYFSDLGAISRKSKFGTSIVAKRRHPLKGADSELFRI